MIAFGRVAKRLKLFVPGEEGAPGKKGEGGAREGGEHAPKREKKEKKERREKILFFRGRKKWSSSERTLSCWGKKQERFWTGFKSSSGKEGGSREDGTTCLLKKKSFLKTEYQTQTEKKKGEKVLPQKSY